MGLCPEYAVSRNIECFYNEQNNVVFCSLLAINLESIFRVTFLHSANRNIFLIVSARSLFRHRRTRKLSVKKFEMGINSPLDELVAERSSL